MSTTREIIFFVLLSVCVSCSKRPDILINDFEGENYGNWQATGNAFGAGPAGRRIDGIRDIRAASSFKNVESGVGTLMSPKLKIDRRYINFLVGGGELPDSTGIQLLVDDEVVFKSTGNNKPKLEWQTWEVREFKGKSAQIMIFDFAAGKEGYIVIDQIVLSDVSAMKAKADLQKQFTLEKRYLLFPVKTGAQLRDMNITINTHSVRYFNIELADEDSIDYWAFIDLSKFMGKAATIRVDQYWDSNPDGLNSLVESDSIDGTMKAFDKQIGDPNNN